MIAPLPENEQQRLAWLDQCGILDTPPEDAFDEVARLAADFCQMPIVAINLVDQNRQWTKAAVGQDKTEDVRGISFCAHTILGSEVMVVPDAQKDPRFTDNPLVTGDPNIRFYAGAPLITTEGFAVGSLCLVDQVPRQISQEQVALLRLLAKQVVSRIELIRHIALQTKLVKDRGRLIRKVRQSAQQQRIFMQDVLSSATQGRLHVCHRKSQLPRPAAADSRDASADNLEDDLTKGELKESNLKESEFRESDASSPKERLWIPLTRPSDIKELRRRAAAATVHAGFSEARSRDLVTAASEAAMNAVVHGGGGRGRVLSCGTAVQVWVVDSGKGIDAERLPRATLERGYTTAGTLGLGMKLMLDTVDRVSLMTGSGGTTLVLEKCREESPPQWLLETGHG